MNEKEYEGPKRGDLFVPLMNALKKLGGSGRVDEINDKVIEILSLSDEDADFPHTNGAQTKVEYELAWARTLLKYIKFLDNTVKGVWVLTPKGQESRHENSEFIVMIRKYWKERKEQNKIEEKEIKSEVDTGIDEDELKGEEVEDDWRGSLIKILKSLNPYGFEKLAQRILRESGFTNVKITKRSHDGGLDGKGILRMNNLVSVPIIFECKRYNNPVGAEKIRSFRGAMEGRADRGLFITTSTFTRDAIEESKREGAKLIDLIDGEQFMDLLKDLKLGIKVELVEKINIDEDWFKEFQ